MASKNPASEADRNQPLASQRARDGSFLDSLTFEDLQRIASFGMLWNPSRAQLSVEDDGAVRSTAPTVGPPAGAPAAEREKPGETAQPTRSSK